MSGKKGQVSVFIVIGLLLLVIVGLFLYFRADAQKEISADDELMQDLHEKKIITGMADQCIRQVADQGLDRLGAQGGYIDVPSLISFGGTSYWYIDDVNIQPSLDQARQRLEQYINENLPACFDFSYYYENGYQVETASPNASVLFRPDDVYITVHYPIKIYKEDYIEEHLEHSITIDTGFRKVFEAASAIINKQLEYDFSETEPLRDLDPGRFGIEYVMAEDGKLIYTITDPLSAGQSGNYQFTFASAFGLSSLKRTIELPQGCEHHKSALPNMLYSPDRLAQLQIPAGTTFNKGGRCPDEIFVWQEVKKSVTRAGVAISEDEEDNVQYGDITWYLDYPVYHFEPTGMRFNQPQRLMISWDEEKRPHKDNMGILYDDGQGWRPIPALADYEKNIVLTDIPGFSSYTAIDCGSQGQKSVTVESKMGDTASCILKTLILAAISIGVMYWMAPAAAGTVGGTTATESLTTATGTLAQTGTSGTSFIGQLAANPSVWSIVSAVTTTGWITAVAVGMIGGMYLPNDMLFSDVGPDSITFTPTCDQRIAIDEQANGAVGSCKPKADDNEVKGGSPVLVQAVIEECEGGFISQMLCGECSMKCSATYR